jgi:hypothetical protein
VPDAGAPAADGTAEEDGTDEEADVEHAPLD